MVDHLRYLPIDMAIAILEFVEYIDVISVLPLVDKDTKNIVFGFRKHTLDEWLKSNVIVGTPTLYTKNKWMLINAVIENSIEGVIHMMKEQYISLHLYPLLSLPNPASNIVELSLYLNSALVTKYLLNSFKCHSITEDSDNLLKIFVDSGHDNKEHSRPDILTEIMYLCPDVNMRVDSDSNSNSTMLMCAICTGMKNTAKVLIENKASIYAKDNAGCTVIDYVSYNEEDNFRPLLKLLIDKYKEDNIRIMSDGMRDYLKILDYVYKDTHII